MNIAMILLATDFIWMSPVSPRMSFFQASLNLFAASVWSAPVLTVLCFPLLLPESSGRLSILSFRACSFPCASPILSHT